MYNKLFPFLLILLFSTCKDGIDNASSSLDSKKLSPFQKEIPGGIAPNDFNGFTWMNKPTTFEFKGNQLFAQVKKGTVFFNHPEDLSITATAPFFYTEIEDNFIATTQVKPDFSATWNAVSLMLYIDSTNWIKLAFENSVATGKSIVSVVTRGISDDANGPELNEHDTVWLKLIRKADIYALHWSTTGKI